MVQILLVDDDNLLLTMFQQALEHADHTVTIARNGEEALDQMSDGIDLLICDVNMPYMDGRELIRAIRAEPTYQHIKIIAMTAYPNAVKPYGDLEGADGVILKPVSIPKLIDLIAGLGADSA